ncbi:MAG: exodeoxyribonuclease VII small subunit [Desulfomonile sp.]|jgi:exodeoxyribonuclease VII small subunit
MQPENMESTESYNFDSGLDELKSIVEKMESGGLGLQDSLKLFEQGVGVSRRLFEILSQSEGKVEELLADLERVPFSRGEG